MRNNLLWWTSFLGLAYVLKVKVGWSLLVAVPLAAVAALVATVIMAVVLDHLFSSGR